MSFASVQELVQGTRQAIELNGGVRVKDPTALRGETIDRLVHAAVFGEGEVRDSAGWLLFVLLMSLLLVNLYTTGRKAYAKRTQH